jgi:outer membrane protein assembly factor BamB
MSYPLPRENVGATGRVVPRRFAITLAAAGLLAGLASRPSRSDDWPSERADASRSGSTAESVAPPLAPLWSVALPGRILSTPVVAGGRLFAGTDEGRLVCLDAADGRMLWVFSAEGPIEASPAVDGDVVYAVSLDGGLHALQAATGEVLWTARTGGATELAPLVLRDRVVVAAGLPTRDLRAYAKADGTPLWSFTARRPIAGSPALVRAGGRELVVAGDAAGVWSVIDAASGPLPGNIPAWSVLVPAGPGAPVAAAVGADGLLAICPGGADRQVYVIDIAARAVARRIPLPAPPAPEAAAGDFDALLGLPAGLLDAIASGDAASREAALDGAELLLGRPLDALRDILAADAGAATLPPAVDGPALLVLRRERPGDGETLVLARADATSGAVGSAWVSGPRDPAAGGVRASVRSGRFLLLAAGAELLVFDATDPAAGPVARAALPSPAAAPPAVADGRVFLAGADGTLLAFAGGNQPPAAPSDLEPAPGEDVATHYPVFRWSGASDPDPADGPETLAAELEVAVETGGALAGTPVPSSPAALPGAVRVTLPAGASEHAFGAALPANARVAWRVRVRDAAGAASPWTATRAFTVCRDPDPPDPPTGLSVLPLDGAVQLAWTASASPDVVGYNVYAKAGGRSFAQAEVLRLGTVTAAVVGRLPNGESCDVMVTAVDGAGNESAGVVVGAVPQAEIALGDRAGFLTVQQAIDAAAPGETVTLGPKTFRVAGGLILKGGVSLRGYAPHLTVLDGQGAPPAPAPPCGPRTPRRTRRSRRALRRSRRAAGRRGSRRSGCRGAARCDGRARIAPR